MDKLIAPKGRVIIKVDLESKNSHTFADGTKINLARQYDNFNMRYVKPVNATVVNAEEIPEGAEVLIHHNSTHDVYRLFNYLPPTADASTDVRFYSIPDVECFLWRKDGGEWQTLGNYVTALRIFKPYEGAFLGIEPTQLNDILYITSGDLKGNAVLTLKKCDYEIIYQKENGQEGSIIRLRCGESDADRNEVIAIDAATTRLIKEKKYLVGITKSDAKILN